METALFLILVVLLFSLFLFFIMGHIYKKEDASAWGLFLTLLSIIALILLGIIKVVCVINA